MSLRVHLLFNLPQYPITGVSIFLIFIGVCSIAASVFGFIEAIWGSYFATGAWGGGVAIITGLYGAGAAHSKGVCSVTSFAVMAYFCCLVSISQGVMSAAGLEFDSGFYSNSQLYKDINEGNTKLIHSILLGTAGLQFILALILALMCTRHICIGRKREKANQKNVLYGSSPFQRGNERASSSSQAPLVSGRKKPKKKRKKSNTREHSTHNPNHTLTTCDHHQTFTDSEPRVRGRRFGNMPVAGANVVEAQNFSRCNSRNSSMRGHRSITNANDSTRSSRRRQRPPLPQLQGSRYDRETQGLLTQVQNKLALESGDTSFIDAPSHEVMMVPRASVSEFDLLEVTAQTSRPCDPSPSFIPMTDAFNQPLSIEDDDELPPYEERSHFPESVSRNDLDEEINNLFNFDRQSDTLTFNSDINSSSTFRSDERQTNIGNARPVSYFDEPRAPLKRERSHTLGSIPISPNYSLDPEREKIMPDYFLKDQDPQGVSYCEFSRERDTLVDDRKRRHNGDSNVSKYSVERALQRENSLKNTKNPLEEMRSKNNDFCYSKPFFPASEVDPRRLSKASTVSLPAGFAPPKPPRIFTVEMSSLQSPLSESQEMAKPVERKPDNALNIDLSQVVLRRKKPSAQPSYENTRKQPFSHGGLNSQEQKGPQVPESGTKTETQLPLSIKTSQAEDPFSTFSNTKPYAQSSPKLKTFEQLTLPTISPSISPIPSSSDPAKNEESSFSENVVKNGGLSEDRNVIKSTAKKRAKLDVRRKDPHPLSLLPYLTKSVSEFTNGNSIPGMDSGRKDPVPSGSYGAIKPNNDHTVNEDSDEALKKLLGIQSNGRNSDGNTDLKQCNLKSGESEQKDNLNNWGLLSDEPQKNSSVKKFPSMSIHSRPFNQEPVSNSSQVSNAAGKSGTRSGVKIRQPSGSPSTVGPTERNETPNERHSAVNVGQRPQDTSSRNQPIYSILL